MQKKEVINIIKDKYGEIAKASNKGGCCSGCCCGNTSKNAHKSAIDIVYDDYDISAVPSESNLGLGCGNPITNAELVEGETVLDLGSGGGLDCFLARNRVGEKGYVIGVDMTPDMVELAQKNKLKSGYNNIDFRLGEIENLPVDDNSVDVIISNCVINLSLDKNKAFREAFRVLKKGGRLCISDVVATAELPEHIKADLTMLTGCIAGAEHIGQINKMLINAGFRDIELMPKDNSRKIISSWAPGTSVEDYVASYIIKAKKL